MVLHYSSCVAILSAAKSNLKRIESLFPVGHQRYTGIIRVKIKNRVLQQTPIPNSYRR